MARPCSYTEEIAAEICQVVSETTVGLMRLCEERDHWPSWFTVFRWQDERPEFRERYLRARESRADRLFDECVAIADDAADDWVERQRENGSTYVELDRDHVRRSELRVNTRLRVAAKLNPRKYGDSLNVTGKVVHSLEALVLASYQARQAVEAQAPAAIEHKAGDEDE